MIARLTGVLAFVVLAAALLVVQFGFVITLAVIVTVLGAVIGCVVLFIEFVRAVAHQPVRGHW